MTRRIRLHVEALADRWGWTPRHRGKTVWAAINCDQP